jgi:hypothetical protein
MAPWRGTRPAADGARQRWALAIGHACTPDRQLTVTFTRRLPGSRRARRKTVHPAALDGLWVAAVTGHYTTTRCHTTTAASALRLMPVTDRTPPC